MTAPTLFDAIEAREEAIVRVGNHCDPDWWDAAFAAVVCAASVLSDFTTDDVRARIPEDVQTHNPAALGHVMRAARDCKLIKKAGGMRMTRDPIRHRELTIWTQA